jgi:hypothetical protein
LYGKKNSSVATVHYGYWIDNQLKISTNLRSIEKANADAATLLGLFVVITQSLPGQREVMSTFETVKAAIGGRHADE